LHSVGERTTLKVSKYCLSSRDDENH